MSNAKFTIGIDFGTESGRVVIFDIADGREVAEAVHAYANGVIATRLPETNVNLEPDWALQDPQDYLAVLEQAVPQVLAKSGWVVSLVPLMPGIGRQKLNHRS